MRKQYNLDTLIDDFSYPELPEVRKYFDFCCHGIDKLGRPVYVEKMGTIDIPRLLQVTTQERLIQYLRYTHEVRLKIRFPICSELAGKRIETLVVVQDCSGASVDTVNREAFQLLKAAAVVGSDCYPETLGLYLIVNAPSFFPFIWAVIRGFVDEKTRRSVRITSQSD